MRRLIAISCLYGVIACGSNVAEASLLLDDIQINSTSSLNAPPFVDEMSFDDTVTVDTGQEVNQTFDLFFFSPAAQLIIDVDPINETIDVTFTDLSDAASLATFVSSSTIFSDLDWLDSLGQPIPGSISSTSIVSNPSNLPFGVSNTADSISLEATSPFGIADLSTNTVTIAYVTAHGVPEPSTFALLGLGLLCAGVARRRNGAT